MNGVHEMLAELKTVLGRAVLAATLLLLVFASAPARAGGSGEKGKKLFVDSGCNKCHSLLAEGIEVVEDDEEAEEADDDDPFGMDEDEDEEEPPDLSGIATHWKHGEDGLKDWLNKKLEIDGDLHKKKFPGERGELKTLAAWLMTLTTPAPEMAEGAAK